jgi:hypothetical protein
VAIGNTLSEEKQIENGVVHGAVLSVTLVALAEITHGIEELIKIIGYADDWIIHNTHQHERVSVVKKPWIKSSNGQTTAAFKSQLKK